VLKNKRLVSFIAMLAICFSFLVPAFMAPDQAAASSTYSVMSAPTIGKSASINLGSVEVYIANVNALASGYDILTVTLPTEVKIASGTETYPNVVVDNDEKSLDIFVPQYINNSTNPLHPNINGRYKPDPSKEVYVSLPNDTIWAKITSPNSFDIYIDTTKVKANTNQTSEAKFYLYFYKFDTTGYTGDITATFMPALAGTSGLTAGSAVIGKVSSGTGTTAMVKSVKTVSKADNQTIDTIIIAETQVASINSGDYIKLKLPSGVTWSDSFGVVSGSWGFDNQYNFKVEKVNARELKVTRYGNDSSVLSGRINIGVEGLSASTLSALGRDVGEQTGSGLFKINVADTVANGDITCSVSGSDGITDQDIVIAKVGDYGITVSEGEKTEVVSGKKEQKLGSFYIEESLKESFIQGRTIKLTLPDGCKWEADYTPKFEIQSGTVNGDLFTAAKATRSTTDYNVATFTIKSTTTEAVKVKIYDGKIQISPSFSGPIKIAISGTAGVTGEVTVADCKPAINVTADATKKVIIGLPNQVASDITISEVVKGAIMDNSSVASPYFDIELPSGVTFASVPTVKVVEGDLDIDSYKLTKNDTVLRIKIESSSTKPSKIAISNVKLTLNRTVPEGELKAKFTAIEGTYALDETTMFESNKDSAGSVIIATCVTPAPANQGRSALFTIGSNVATINGTNIIMETAPYIKAGRTYIPVRYLADALGATTEWDPATQTATLTLGDKSVVLVIGSKVEKVNGADVTMDVAPEIVNNRTMLPARYVAEGLGYQVGWNGVTKQVIIQ